MITMSVTFTREEIDVKLAGFEEEFAVLKRQVDFWTEIRDMLPESENEDS